MAKEDSSKWPIFGLPEQVAKFNLSNYLGNKLGFTLNLWQKTYVNCCNSYQL